MKAKNIIICILAVLALAQTAFTEDYLVKLPQNSEHYVIDDNVNVRAEPSLSGKKLFKLNTGDKVVILSKSLADYDYYRMEAAEWEKAKAEAECEPFLLTEGLWAPWYKIKSDKGEGYISGRYVSCRELELDFDCDGKTEVLACLTTSKIKGMLQFRGEWWNVYPYHEYWEKGCANRDINHVLIKDKKAVPVEFPDCKSLKQDCIEYYELDDSKRFTPPVCVLMITSISGKYDFGKQTVEYYYFNQNKFLPIFSFDIHEEGTAFSAVECKENSIIYELTVQLPYYIGDKEYYQTEEDSETYYTWDGKTFSKKKIEQEIEYSKEYLDWLENNPR